MDWYKKIIKSQKARFIILNSLSWLPDKIMLKIQYKIKLGRRLKLENAERFTEKIQIYKLKYKNNLMHKCVDKYLVRDYIKSKGLENILNECYGVYSNAKEIDFNKLPQKFVIKTTNGGGGQNVFICKNKNEIKKEEVKQQINEWVRNNPKKSYSREWAYETNTNNIIIEKYLEGNEDGLTGINDYKFFCFNGKVEYIVFDGDRYKKHKRNFYDKNWNYLDIKSDCENFGDIIKKPIALEQMKSIAEKLSQDFTFVRVDLYWINNKIYFGELTFYPWTGYVVFDPREFDMILGENISL